MKEEEIVIQGSYVGYNYVYPDALETVFCVEFKIPIEVFVLALTLAIIDAECDRTD